MAYPAYDGLLASFNNSEWISSNSQRVRAAKGAELKRLGVVPGMTDLILLVPKINQNVFIPGLLIEMKKPDGKLQENQIFMHELIRTQGFRVTTCYDWEDAKIEITNHMGER